MLLDQIPFTLDTDALFRRLRLDPQGDLAGDIHQLAHRAAGVARPKALFAESFVGSRGTDTVTIAGVTFTSRVLRSNLEKVERVFPYIATCGVELDALLDQGADVLLRYCLDCIKEMALAAARRQLREYLAQHYGLKKLSSMNPGSGDSGVWPLEQQAPLFSLLGDVEGQIGVRLTESFLMEPNKTVSGVLFATEVDFVTCSLCHRIACPSRRAPFDEGLWREKHGNAIG